MGKKTFGGAVFVVLFALTGCTGAPAPTVTVTVPGPTVTVYVEADPEADPEPEAEEDASSGCESLFEVTGEGAVNVTMHDGVAVRQEDTDAPYKVGFGDGCVDPEGYYVVVAQTMKPSKIGCRLTVNGVVVDEVKPKSGTTYVECVKQYGD